MFYRRGHDARRIDVRRRQPAGPLSPVPCCHPWWCPSRGSEGTESLWASGADLPADTALGLWSVWSMGGGRRPQVSQRGHRPLRETTARSQASQRDHRAVTGLSEGSQRGYRSLRGTTARSQASQRDHSAVTGLSGGPQRGHRPLRVTTASSQASQRDHSAVTGLSEGPQRGHRPLRGTGLSSPKAPTQY